MAHDEAVDEPKKLLGIGDEAIGHMSRLSTATRSGEALIIKQALEVVLGSPSLPAGGLYGMVAEDWIGHKQRRRLTIEWDEVLPSYDAS